MARARKLGQAVSGGKRKGSRTPTPGTVGGRRRGVFVSDTGSKQAVLPFAPSGTGFLGEDGTFKTVPTAQDILDAKLATVADESGLFPNSRELLAGANITFDDGVSNQRTIAAAGGGGGDVVGPASATDHAIVRFDLTTGKLVQDSVVTLDDAGVLGFADGVRQTFNPDGTTPGLNVGANAGDPSTPSDGDLWYNSSTGQLKARINGVSVVVGNVLGPASATDHAIPRFDLTTGKLLLNSLVTISDTGVLGFPDGVRQVFNPDATNAGLNVGAQAGDPSGPADGDLWYDSSASQLKARINGATVVLGASSSGDVVGPGSSTDEAIARFDSTTGKLLQDCLVTITDPGAIIFPDGVRQTFNPDGTTPGLNAGAQAGDPSAPADGDVWYDATAALLRAHRRREFLPRRAPADTRLLVSACGVRRAGRGPVRPGDVRHRRADHGLGSHAIGYRHGQTPRHSPIRHQGEPAYGDCCGRRHDLLRD